MEIDLYLIQLLFPSNRINTGRCWSSTVLRMVDIVGVKCQKPTHRMCQPIKCKTLENVNIVGVACTRPPRRMCWSIECKTLKTVVIKWKFNCWFHVWIDYIYILENVRLICYRFFFCDFLVFLNSCPETNSVIV